MNWNIKSKVGGNMKLCSNGYQCEYVGAGTAYPSEAPEFISGFQWGLCWSCHPISRLHVFSSVFRCPVRFMRENVRFVITLICVVEGS